MEEKISSVKHPPAMYWLALTEICQRFAFWGVGNLLVLYLVQSERFTDFTADNLYGAFTAVAFILPIFGGYVADRTNYRLPILWGMFCTALGCFLIATGAHTLLYVSLALLAIGTSIFTPSIYALLGHSYHGKHHLRDAGFSIYYAAVNIGGFLAMVILGAIGQTKSWKAAFITAGVIQLFGLFPYFRALKHLAPSLAKSKELSLERAQEGEKSLKKHEKDRIFVICCISFFTLLFWICYNQGGSSMNLFALRFTDRTVLGFEMPPTWLLSTESLYLILLAFPLASLYLYLAKRKKDPSPPVKAVCSLVMMGICYLIMMWGSSTIAPGAKSAALSPFYLIGAYLFMALGEMLIAPVGLSLITHLSPHRYVGMLVGFWYVCTGVAFYLGGAIAPLMSRLHTLSQFFSIFVILAFVAAFVLLLFVKKLNRMRHIDVL